MKALKKRDLVTLVAIAMMAQSCGKDNASVTPSITLSGSLSATGSGALIGMPQGEVSRYRVEGGGGNLAIAYTTLSLVCSTLSSPPASGTGTISADGTFTVSIAGGANQPLSCTILNSSGVSIGSFITKDTSKKDLNGNSKFSDSNIFSGDLNLGPLTFDTDAGEVTIPASVVGGIKSLTLDSGSVFDPTGNWTIAGVDFGLPKGVRSTCTAAEQHNDTCNGPPDGVKIFLNRIVGKDSSDGTPVYGMQVWQDESGGDPSLGYTACGSKVGMTGAQATAIGVDLSSYGSALDVFQFATSITISGASKAITAGYKIAGATSDWGGNASCGPANVSLGGTSYHAWACLDPTSHHFQINTGGGCVDSSNTAVNLDSWQAWPMGGCSESTLANGFYKNTCTGPQTVGGVSKTITCSNTYGVFSTSVQDDITSTLTPVTKHGCSGQCFSAADFDWSAMNANSYNSGATCASIATLAGGSNQAKILSAQCYAQYYEKKARSSGLCLPRIQTDWSTSVLADVVKVDFRPNALVFFEKFDYASAASGGMLTRQEEMRGAQVKDSSGNQQWVPCKVVDKGGLTITKLSDTKLLATYVSSQTTSSVDQPACVAQFSGKVDKFIFYLTK